MPETSPALPDLTTVFGFGVAGNFAGHLVQAGEAADFVGIGEDEPEAPKGIFPWFVPGGAPAADAGGPVDLDAADASGVPAFLRTFPISRDTVVRPPGDEVNLQIEPEVGLLARVTYDAATGNPAALQPLAFGAFNDCSIRRPGAKKISHKKNWGPSSKGLAPTLLLLDSLDPAGPTATFRLACFLRRDGQTHAYGIDSRLPDYSYYGATLTDWILDRLAHQHGSPDTPLEDVGAYLQASGRPDHVLVGIGATRYTELGETTFLEIGDDAIVVVYDSTIHAPEQIAAAAEAGAEEDLLAASVLRQRVVGTA